MCVFVYERESETFEQDFKKLLAVMKGREVCRPLAEDGAVTDNRKPQVFIYKRTDCLLFILQLAHQLCSCMNTERTCFTAVEVVSSPHNHTKYVLLEKIYFMDRKLRKAYAHSFSFCEITDKGLKCECTKFYTSKVSTLTLPHVCPRAK